jgi:hypothetical protein
MSFDELEAGVARTLQQPVAPDQPLRPALVSALLSLYARDLVEIHAARWEFSTTVSARPRASPYVRCLAERGAPVVNAALGTFFLPTPLLRRLVILLDGTRSLDDLLEALSAETPPAEQEGLTVENLRRRLQLLADNALLTG